MREQELDKPIVFSVADILKPSKKWLGMSKANDMQWRILWDGRDELADWVYFILAFDWDGWIGTYNSKFVKIGVSVDPCKRLEQMRTGNPYDLYIWRVVRGGYELEKKLHDHLDRYRANGEWFETNDYISSLVRNVPYSWEAESYIWKYPLPSE